MRTVHGQLANRRLAAGGLLSAGAVQGSTLVSGIVAARLLGVEARGELAFIFVASVVLAVLGTLGVPSAVGFFIARGASTDAVVRRVAPIYGAQVVAVTAMQVLILSVAEPLRGDLAVALWSAPVPALYITYQYALAVMQGESRLQAYNVWRPAPLFLYAVFMSVFAATGGSGLLASAIVYSAAMVCGCLCAAAFALRERRRVGGEAPPLRRLITFGLRSLLGTASALDQLQLDQALVALLLPTEDLGLYVAAVAFANLPKLIATSIGGLAFGRIAAQVSDLDRRHEAGRWARTGAILIIGVAAPLAAASPLLVPLAFGSDFDAASTIAPILILAGALQAMQRVVSDIARGLGRPGLASVAEAIALALTLPLVVALTAALSLDGTAAAYAIGSACGLLAVTILVPRAERRTRSAVEDSPCEPIVDDRARGYPEV